MSHKIDYIYNKTIPMSNCDQEIKKLSIGFFVYMYVWAISDWLVHV